MTKVKCQSLCLTLTQLMCLGNLLMKMEPHSHKRHVYVHVAEKSITSSSIVIILGQIWFLSTVSNLIKTSFVSIFGHRGDIFRESERIMNFLGKSVLRN